MIEGVYVGKGKSKSIAIGDLVVIKDSEVMNVEAERGVRSRFIVLGLRTIGDKVQQSKRGKK